jgi:hypothetical protein
MADSLQAAARHLGASLEPLAQALSGPDEAIVALVEQLGWTLPSVPPALKALGADAEKLADSHVALELSLSRQASGVAAGADVGAQYVELAADVASLLKALSDLPSALSAQLPAPFVSATGLPNELPRRLLDLCVYELMTDATRRMEPVLRIAGVVEVADEPADPGKFQPAYRRRTIHWDRFGKLLGDPAGLMRDVYGWGTPAFDGRALLDEVMNLSFALAGPADLDWPAPERIQALTGTLPPFDDVGPPQLAVTLLKSEAIEAGVTVLPLEAAAGALPGVALAAWAKGGVPPSMELSELLTLQLDEPAGLAAGASLALRPGQAPKARIGLEGPSGSELSAARVGATLKIGRSIPLELLSLPGGSGLAVKAVAVGGGVGATPKGAQPYVDVGIEGGKLTVGLGDRDSFLATILPGGPIELDFDLAIAWTQAGGIALRGGGELKKTISLHAELGPFRIETLNLVGTLAGDTLGIEASLTGGGELGPFSATVDRIGLQAALALHRGNLGPVDVQVGFKPPSGLGMEVDAGAIKGGGYLKFDPAKGEYAGVLELSLEDIVQIKAIGLLTTKMPSGGDGYSLLLILTAEFPPIQLGFGFTLVGVGGLIGTNRTMAVDVLRSGLRNHALDSILFPPDPVHDAPRIISDLGAAFPPAEGRYLFGPMLELGWGTPTLISASFGFILELPDPIRIAILGQVKSTLPSEDAPLVQLHMDVLGIADFGQKTLSIDASIYDSSILAFSLYGDMAFRLNWGDTPSFALSLGGLHPRFQPPPGFPTLRRLTLSLGSGSNPRLSCDNYMAITSNSVQFGAHLELYAEAMGFGVHGWLGFDVLFVLSPFSFDAGMSAGVDLLAGGDVLMGISLDFHLSGPTPWRARGTATFTIVFFDVSFDFDISWGDDHQATLPPVDALAPLLAALADPGNWSAALPGGAEQAVSLAAAPPSDDAIVVHPLGRLAVHEHVAPLNVTISRFGSGVPAGWNHFEIADVNLNGKVAPTEVVQDRFARGQFFEMPDEDKLSKPSFEMMDAGVRVGLDNGVQGHVSQLQVHYETKIVDDPVLPPRLLALYWPLISAFGAHLDFGAAALSKVLGSGDAKYTNPGVKSGVATAEVAHVIASTEDLSVSADLGGGASQVFAEQALQAHLADHPEDAGKLQVVPEFEAVAG